MPARRFDGPAPELRAPDGATDTHVHVFSDRFPGHPDGPPPLSDVTFADFKRMRRRLGLSRSVVVQPNAYQTDNACLLWALDRLGVTARGIAAVAPGIDESVLADMSALGVRGARFMNLPGGAVSTAHLSDIIARTRPFGWSCIVQMKAGDLPEQESLLASVEGYVVIDLMAMTLTPEAGNRDVENTLRRLMDGGNCYVKLSGRYSRLLPPDVLAAFDALAATVTAHAPERVLWASNWPHIGVPDTALPDDASLLDLLPQWSQDSDTHTSILVDNPARLYGFDPP